MEALNVQKYLNKWSGIAAKSPIYDDYTDYEDVYKEIAGFLSDQVKMRGMSRSVAVNMCFSLLINQLIRMGVCPACEFYAASDTIHKEMGCPNVH